MDLCACTCAMCRVLCALCALCACVPCAVCLPLNISYFSFIPPTPKYPLLLHPAPLLCCFCDTVWIFDILYSDVSQCFGMTFVRQPVWNLIERPVGQLGHILNWEEWTLPLYISCRKKTKLSKKGTWRMFHRCQLYCELINEWKVTQDNEFLQCCLFFCLFHHLIQEEMAKPILNHFLWQNLQSTKSKITFCDKIQKQIELAKKFILLLTALLLCFI